MDIATSKLEKVINPLTFEFGIMCENEYELSTQLKELLRSHGHLLPHQLYQSLIQLINYSRRYLDNEIQNQDVFFEEFEALKIHIVMELNREQSELLMVYNKDFNKVKNDYAKGRWGIFWGQMDEVSRMISFITIVLTSLITFYYLVLKQDSSLQVEYAFLYYLCAIGICIYMSLFAQGTVNILQDLFYAYSESSC